MHKQRGDSSTIRRPVRVVVAPATTLKTRLNLGDHASPWKILLPINGTENLQFLWSTTVTGAAGGSWEVLGKTGNSLARGTTNSVPASGKSLMFSINFRNIAYSKSHKVRMTPRFSSGRRTSAPTATVYIIRAGLSKPTEFQPNGLQGTLAEETEKIRKKYNVPALAGAIITDKGIVSIAAAGKRKHGSRTPATHTDKWHLGADTKAMTATLISVLIAKNAVSGNRLSWASTVAEVFPEFRNQMNSDFKQVNLECLLAHRSGLTNPNSTENSALSNTGNNIIVRRREYTRLITGRNHSGTVHATLADWAKFIKFQFTGSEGNLHISQARIRAIQRAYPSDDMTSYGFGWGVGRDPKLGLVLSHDGSNKKWYSHALVFPEQKLAYLTVSNIGGDIRDASGKLIQDHGHGDQACIALRKHLPQRSGR